MCDMEGNNMLNVIADEIRDPGDSEVLEEFRLRNME